MKDCRIKGLLLLTVLLIAISTVALMASQETQIQQHTQTKESLKFYPHTYDQCPELPSPYTMEGGMEIVIAFTKDNKFTLIPVTVEKGESLGYREREWDKIGILEVDTEDFPTLARTGFHSEIELDHTRWITGRSIAEITDSGRPGGSSGAGFMGQEEDIISVLKGDNRLVKKLRLIHPQLAKPLFHVWNIIRWVSFTSRSVGRSIDGIDYFLYNKRKVRLISGGGRGWQSSIFNDEILGMYHIEFRIELDEDEKAFLQGRYSNLSDEQMTDFQKMLSHIHTGEMVPFYIMRYGFYEGHICYRADPIAISFIFGLRSLGEIEKAFAGKLYKVLTEDFTRENISWGGGDMKNKIRVILGIILLMMGCINGFVQESQSSEQEKIDQLIKKFWSISYGEWGSVGEALREIGDPVIEPLIKKLRNEDMSGWSQYRIEWHQRRIAWALGAVRTERAIELLIEILQDRTLHDYGRYEAAMALRRIKPEKAVEPLIKVLNDKESNPPPRFGAAYALGDIQSEKAVPSLINALEEEDVQIRMGAVYGLGHIGSDEAVSGLMKALKDKDGYIRRLTYPHLIRLRPEKKIEFLIMALKEEDWGAREDSVKALVEIGEPMSEYLIPLLKDDESVVQWEAARILGVIQLERTVGVLIEALKDSDWMVRNEAAVALVRINSGNAIEPLIGMLENNYSYVREEAAWILGEMKSERAVNPLVDSLKEKDSGWMAAMALGKIQSEKAVEPLIRALKEKNRKKRRAAAWALEKIPSDKTVKPLKAALKDADEEVRMWAAEALKRNGTPKALKAVKKHKIK